MLVKVYLGESCGRARELQKVIEAERKSEERTVNILSLDARMPKWLVYLPPLYSCPRYNHS